MDRIKRQVFMGNGGCGCTGAQIAHLYGLLSDCLDKISVVQQIQTMPPVKLNDDMTHEEWQDHVVNLRDEAEQDERAILEKAKEIFLALTGRKVLKTGKPRR